MSTVAKVPLIGRMTAKSPYPKTRKGRQPLYITLDRKLRSEQVSRRPFQIGHRIMCIFPIHSVRKNVIEDDDYSQSTASIVKPTAVRSRALWLRRYSFHTLPLIANHETIISKKSSSQCFQFFSKVELVPGSAGPRLVAYLMNDLVN
jgi:hypothetical protein